MSDISKGGFVHTRSQLYSDPEIEVLSKKKEKRKETLLNDFHVVFNLLRKGVYVLLAHNGPYNH